MDQVEATQYLDSLLGRMLRIYIKDTRMFLGEFKCTDNVSQSTIAYLTIPFLSYLDRHCCSRLFLFVFLQECNIILAKTCEYRMPSEQAKIDAPASQDSKGASGLFSPRVSMTSRFLGLVVIPGPQITKIEVEERPVYGLPIRPPPA